MITFKLIKEITKNTELEGAEVIQQRIQAVMDTWDATPEGKRHKEDLEKVLMANISEDIK